MACSTYGSLRDRTRLSAYLDGELADGGSSRDQFQDHLRTCADCRAALADLEGTSRLLAVAPELFESDPNFVARFWARVDETLGAPAELWRWVALRLLPVSLATLAAAVLTVVLERRGVEPFSDLERSALALGSPPMVGEIAADSELVADPLASPLALKAPRSYRPAEAGDP